MCNVTQSSTGTEGAEIDLHALHTSRESCPRGSQEGISTISSLDTKVSYLPLSGLICVQEIVTFIVVAEGVKHTTNCSNAVKRTTEQNGGTESLHQHCAWDLGK